MTGRPSFLKLLFLSCLLLLSHQAVRAEEISVRALVEKETVTLGEPFLFQIQVAGTDTPPGRDTPNLSGLDGFSVEPLGMQNNSRSSISIVNGKMSKVEFRGYVCSFRLTPQKLGQLQIPPVAVAVDTRTLETQPVTIRVVEPEKTEDFHLELKFSKTQFYVGEPISVTVVWYVARDVESFSFNLPILENRAFAFVEPRMPQDAGRQMLKIPLRQGSVLAERGQAVLKGREYTTVTFRKTFFAREPGVFKIPEATVSCRVVAGIGRKGMPRNPFDNFFDDGFGNPRSREITKTFVARSEPVALNVAPLPDAGRPANFSGAVGHFELHASASPTDVSVGDPITLTLALSGTDYLENLELPPLAHDPELAADFKIPEETAVGTVKDGTKIFTQTLRAKNDKVKSIPPLGFAYFDPERESYQVARSAAIPVQVKPTRLVTENDVEGRAEKTLVRNELEAWSQGIAHNYEGPDLLEDQRFRPATAIRSPAWSLALALPLLVYLTLLTFMRVRKTRLSNAEKVRAVKAYGVFKGRMKRLDFSAGREGDFCEQLLEALRSYLGDKLQLQGAALTFADVSKHLHDQDVAPDTVKKLEELFTLCEQGSYGGGLQSSGSLEQLVKTALEVIQALNNKI